MNTRDQLIEAIQAVDTYICDTPDPGSQYADIADAILADFTVVARKTERAPQPETLKVGQLWMSRRSGGIVRLTPSRWRETVEWERVSGRGARTGFCHSSNLRTNYDYVGDADTNAKEH